MKRIDIAVIVKAGDAQIVGTLQPVRRQRTLDEDHRKPTGYDDDFRKVPFLDPLIHHFQNVFRPRFLDKTTILRKHVDSLEKQSASYQVQAIFKMLNADIRTQPAEPAKPQIHQVIRQLDAGGIVFRVYTVQRSSGYLLAGKNQRDVQLLNLIQAFDVLVEPSQYNHAVPSRKGFENFGIQTRLIPGLHNHLCVH